MEKNKVYIETYGCQMNLADTEIILGILQNNGYTISKYAEDADVLFLTSSRKRHKVFKGYPTFQSRTFGLVVKSGITRRWQE